MYREETGRGPETGAMAKGLREQGTVEVESREFALQWAVELRNRRREEHEFGFGYVNKSLLPGFSFGCQILGVDEGCVGYIGHESAKQATVGFLGFFFSITWPLIFRIISRFPELILVCILSSIWKLYGPQSSLRLPLWMHVCSLPRA